MWLWMWMWMWLWFWFWLWLQVQGVMAGVQSVAVNTDLSMKDIELLQGEIGELRTEVERLHQKLVRSSSRGVELKPKHEDLFSLTWPSLHCKLETSPVLIDQWEELEPDPSPLLSLKGCKAEIHSQHEDQDQLLELFSSPRPPLHCKSELNPVLIKSEDIVGRKQNSLLALKQELCLVPECKPEPHLTLAEDLYCSIYKPEPELLEMMCTQAQSEEQPVLGTLRTCSVKLVDCRKALDVSEGEQNGDEGGKDLSDSVQVRSATIEPGGKRKTKTPARKPPYPTRRRKCRTPVRPARGALRISATCLDTPQSTAKRIRSAALPVAKALQDPPTLTATRPVTPRDSSTSAPTTGNGRQGLRSRGLTRTSTAKASVCHTCGRGFSDWSSFRKHKLLHTREKPYGCSTHWKRLSCSSTHRTHQRTNGSDQQHSCITCGKRFSSSSGYHKHLKTHSRQKPYPCVKCSRTFTCSTHLRKDSRACHRKSGSKKASTVASANPL